MLNLPERAFSTLTFAGEHAMEWLEDLVDYLTEHDIKLATAESCTAEQDDKATQKVESRTVPYCSAHARSDEC
tara:strand:- start:226 stop:444 length:219 start_codon:yes stop_codon:yes gene_type:complete